MREEPLAEWERDLLTEHDVQAVLAEHVLTSGFDEVGDYWKYACGCGWTSNSDDDHRAHIAAMITPVLTQARRQGAAEALDEAAGALLMAAPEHALETRTQMLDRHRQARWLRDRAATLRQ